MTVPCPCCPAGPPRCALVPVQFTGVSQTVAQAGWNQSNLSQTIDGNTGNQTCGYNSPGNNTASTTLRVTYTVAPQDRVRGLRLWNQGGNDLSDFDGLGTFNAEFYAGAVLLATLPCSGVNGGQAQSFTLPGGQALNGVDRVVLRELGKLSTSSVAPLWRELQLLEVQPVFPCRRANGALQWYSVAGVPVPNGDVFDCPEVNPLVLDDFTIQGAAFNFTGDGSGADEGMLLNPPAATTNTGTVQVSPGLYHPSNASPTMPCGGRRMDLTFPPGSSFDFAYTNVGGSNAGGVYIQLVAPSLGGSLNFGPFSVGTFVPGQTRTITVLGGVARLTYLGGPTNANAPQSSGATCGLTSVGPSLIALHFGNTSTADFPIRFNISFATS